MSDVAGAGAFPEGAVVYNVEGMTCGGCVRSVTAALARVGVRAEVSLADATVTVAEPADDVRVQQALEGAGYVFVGRR